MGAVQLFVLAVGLSMDAFAVSVCKGLSVPQCRFRHALLAGMYFGGFQAAMPLLGYLLGIQFQKYIIRADHWIAFVLLGVIGVNMIWESCEDSRQQEASFSAAVMLPLAVATSIDALAVGVTFVCLQVSIVPAAMCIGLTACVCSMFGIKAGNLFGAHCRCYAERGGGIVLILMGCKILLEHLGILP